MADRIPSRQAKMQIAFHPLSRDDFGLLARWLAEPAVAYWWNHETSRAAIERDFGPVIDGRDPAAVLIAGLAGRPFGLVQHYALADHPEYMAELSSVCAVPAGAASLDYLIGEPDLRGRGLGARVIELCVEMIWKTRPAARHVIVPVHVENQPSWRALERAGFQRVGEGALSPDNPVLSPRHYIYRRQR